MTENMAKSLDIAISNGLMPDSAAATAGFGELDLDLVNALQIDPRASWTRIGASLGVDATTAARRWQRLTDAGLAWITAYPPGLAVIGYLRLHCRADALAVISERVCAMECVFSVERTGGHCQLNLSVAAEDAAALDDLAVRVLGALPGVREIDIAVGTRIYIEGGHWRPGALDPAQRTLLAEDQRRTPPVPFRPRAGDLELMVALGPDGRRSVADLAQDTGLSETTVRRRLADMTRSGRLQIRCDFAQQSAGWSININYWIRLSAGELGAFAAELAQWPEIRLCAAATGASNVLVIAWLRSQHECILLENRLLQSFPNLHITERQLTLRALKRMGRLLAPNGSAVGHIPFGVWATPVA
ncbi:Lrp/AsnC family transcriptional regulator [Nocardia sp. NBC_01503]|uniref:Lrp/AsnC family transcriptional regulator n=1 Tax=Nocardia sp. NBC_01503 TaxID=2975997 RepID=UPI002E7AD6CB|nr:Lrp/AsnC family transcriptional regulator [Nocardia sp. NBC_01503]WTL33523.1 Lrp/AsnC family transcriptional regulator [Nocardia sp. NBC_01503]